MWARSLILAVAIIGGYSAAAYSGEVIAQGNFKGTSDHKTSGRAQIVKEGGKYMVVLGSDFSLDGAPDPYVGLGKDGYDPRTEISKLKNNNGEQTYEVPSGVNAENYDQVFIWCRKYNVPLGVAQIE